MFVHYKQSIRIKPPCYVYLESEFMTLVFNVKYERYNYYDIYPVRNPKVDSAGFIMAGKNNDGLKYGGISEKPPNLTRHI